MITIANLLLAALTLLTCSAAQADLLTSVPGFGGDSGQLAKLEFRLRENYPVTSVAWSPDGRYIATASGFDHDVHIWDVRRRELVQKIANERPSVDFHDLSWSPDSRYLAFCAQEDSLRVYETQTWSMAHTLNVGNSDGISCGTQVTFSSDGQWLALHGRDISIVDTRDWHLIKTSVLANGWGRAHAINAISFIPGTHTLLIAGGEFQNISTTSKYEGRMVGRVWFLGAEETVPGKSYQVYDPDGFGEGGGPAISLAVSPDATQIATGATTGVGGAGTNKVNTQSVHITNSVNGRLLGAPLDGQKFGKQYGLTYTGDGRFLIAGHAESITKAIHVIDAKTLRVVDTVHGVDAIFDLTADPTGRYFAAGTGRAVVVWSLPTVP